MMIITVVITPIFFVNAANDIGALLFARGTDFLSVFDKAQREAFVMLFLNLHQPQSGQQDPLDRIPCSVRAAGRQVTFPAACPRDLADAGRFCIFSP